MEANPTCRDCDIELNDANWYSSYQKINLYICKDCERERQRSWRETNPINSEKARERQRLWREANPEKVKEAWTRASRKRGYQAFNKNKTCSSFLGVHIAEQLLSQAFKNVKRMPMNNPGYDIICNHNKLIDIKSSCLKKDGSWSFNIRQNRIADFFLCIAFDTREDLNPLHAWLLPGIKFNHLIGISIRPNTIHKWDEYRLDITKINECCAMMRSSGQ